jgi:hypothetical protein
MRLDVLTAENVKITVFREVTPCGLVDSTDITAEYATSIFRREEYLN